jgi:hypothetical protein
MQAQPILGKKKKIKLQVMIFSAENVLIALLMKNKLIA